MTPSVTLPAHITFHDLPFCGLLLDTRAFLVFRLSRDLTGVLRRALRGPLAVSPYESLLAEPGDVASADEARMLFDLAARGLLCLHNDPPIDRNG